MINADKIWENFLSDATAYRETQEVYLSPNGGGKYKIADIQNKVVHIDRVNVPGSGETIGLNKFRTAIDRINRSNNVIPKGRIYEHVAEEVTLVELLPFLDWDETGRNILVHLLLPPSIETLDLPEAKNDNPDNRLQVSVRQRKVQKKFRDKLLSVYDSACVITSCSVVEVLHACHINPHCSSGINLSNNGLILRSDIHDLFDQNLIAIHPDSLIVNVSGKLEKTDYYNYHGNNIRKRNDNKEPFKEAFRERWDQFIIN